MPEGSITGFHVLRPCKDFSSYARMPVVCFDAGLPIAADGVVGYRGDAALQLPDGRVVVLGGIPLADAETWQRYLRESVAAPSSRVIVPLPKTKGPTDGR